MESQNLYQHHQLQLQQQQQKQQLVYSSLPSSSSTSSPRAVVSTVQEWNPSSIVLGGDDFNRYMNEILPNSREYFWPKSIDLVPAVKRSILEVDHDAKLCEFRSYVHPLQLDDNSSTPRASLSSDCLLKLCDTNVGILNNNGYIKNGQEQDVIDLNQNLWISSFSDIVAMKQQKLPQAEVFAGLAPCPPPVYMFSCSGSTTDHHHHNFFTSSTSLLPSSASTLPLPTHSMKCSNYDNDQDRTNHPFAERISSGYSHVQQSSTSESPSNSSNKTSTIRKDVWRKKKSPKPRHAASDGEVAKKPRVVPPHSSSSPTLKVRKEKLGDRIAALHRMVSPFGKTDTASVLTEAIGYIQFLQDQIQTLSMSYFKSSRSRLCPTTCGGRLSMKEWEDEEEQKTQDLRSRGLCLVPLAFTSYVCSYNGSIC